MIRRLFGWVSGLSAVGLSIVLIGSGTAVATGGVVAYRTWDWVEHDNDFCLSCHLMVEPYELFAESSHRDMGCKACHKPTLVARSQMGLAQILENPDSLTVHAEVPNEKCASCHIEGDPEKWELIASSAGHRVHLESDDPDLDGLQCVECHSSSLHEFAATDRTCAQSGCHEEIDITLGAMGDFTIHCAACHGFSAPVAEDDPEAALAALAPTSNECLSCHVMRSIAEMPADEPHGQDCSTCHNPHTQDTPEQAVESCASAGCHENPEELSPFHRGLEHGAVEDCSSCHEAHDFRPVGNDCLACHQDIMDDAPGASRGGGGRAIAAARAHASAGLVSTAHPRAPGPADPSPHGPVTRTEFLLAEMSHAPPSGATAAHPASGLSTRGQSVADTTFRHSSHRDVACTACHSTAEAHGTVTVEAPVDCATCHHTTDVAAECASCHLEPVATPGLVVPTTMTLSNGAPRERALPFDHASHPGIDCATCHQEGVDQPVPPASCTSCHEEHHTAEPTLDCAACHEPAPVGVHDVQAHLGCGGAGCHESATTPEPPRNRLGCLACHEELRDHRVGEGPANGECIGCHQLPGLDGGRP